MAGKDNYRINVVYNDKKFDTAIVTIVSEDAKRDELIAGQANPDAVVCEWIGPVLSKEDADTWRAIPEGQLRKVITDAMRLLVAE